MENLEFTVIPKALLTPDKEALMCSDKSKAMHLIEELQCQRNGDEEEYIQSDVLLIVLLKWLLSTKYINHQLW